MPNMRIRLEIPLPSISMKNFIEKLLRDDEFFSLALESPMSAMKQSGMNVSDHEFAPSDFAAFFGALSEIKETLKDSDNKIMSFESIFGRPAKINGSRLFAETDQGYFKQWDNRDAMTDRERCGSTSQEFEIASDITGPWRDAEANRNRQIAVHEDRAGPIGGISTRYEHSETWNHTDRDWGGTERHHQSERGTSAGVSKNFDTDGKGLLSDMLRGPLIHPADLVDIAARIETFVRILR